MWVVVKIMVPFWVPILIRHLLFRGHNFDNYPCGWAASNHELLRFGGKAWFFKRCCQAPFVPNVQKGCAGTLR